METSTGAFKAFFLDAVVDQVYQSHHGHFPGGPNKRSGEVTLQGKRIHIYSKTGSHLSFENEVVTARVELKFRSLECVYKVVPEFYQGQVIRLQKMDGGPLTEQVADDLMHCAVIGTDMGKMQCKSSLTLPREQYPDIVHKFLLAHLGLP